MTEHELKVIELRLERAKDCVRRLCSPKYEAGHLDWVMHIPARPDLDPDLIISATLEDVSKLIRYIKEYDNISTLEKYKSHD